MSTDSLSAFLSVTNRENSESSPLPPAVKRVREQPGLTKSERERQRMCCARLDSFLPVLIDFAWERCRSRVALVLVLLQAGAKLILQAYFPQLGLPAVLLCGDATGLYVSQNPDSGVVFTDADRTYLSSYSEPCLNSYFVYRFFAL